MWKIKLENEKYYHVFNRGANKQEIFLDEKDYFRFLRKARELNNNTTSDYRDCLYRKIRDKNQTKVIPDLGYPKQGMSEKYIFLKYFRELNKEKNW